MNRSSIRLVLAVALVLGVGAFPFAYRYAANHKNLRPFQGRWMRYVGVIHESKFEARPTGVQVVIDGDKMTSLDGVFVIGALDPTQNPPWIDLFTAHARSSKAAPMKGVY